MSQTAVKFAHEHAWPREAQAVAILESISDGFFSLDAQWRMTYVNRAAEKILQRHAADMLGQVFWDVFPGLRESDFGRMYQRVVKEGVSATMTAYYSDHERWYEASANPIGYGLTIYFRDVTDRVQAEEAKAEVIREHARAEIATAAAEAVRASEERQNLATDQRKNEFIATLAHELRTPLAPLSTGLLLMGLRPNDPGNEARIIPMMQRQLSQMVRLIDDLMDVARIANGKVELRKVRVAMGAIVADAVEARQHLIDAAGHRLSVHLPEEPVFLDADPARLVQVIGNLLANAAKYTPDGGAIDLSVSRQGDEVEVSVADTGIGLAEHSLPKVFEMFVQVPGTVELSRGGLGIGLSLVRQLVELHGGSVSATSQGVGMGSTFTLRLPAPAAVPAAAVVPETRAPAEAVAAAAANADTVSA